MNITVFADASFCPKTRASGWGAWAKRNDWQFGRFAGGPFRRDISDASQAELCGLASALYHFDRSGALVDVTKVMLQCDSTHALGYILANVVGSYAEKPKGEGGVAVRPRIHRGKTGERSPLKPIEKEALAAIRKIAKGRTLSVRHVKGHREGDGRNWVNEQCDAEARRHMQAMRVEHWLQEEKRA